MSSTSITSALGPTPVMLDSTPALGSSAVPTGVSLGSVIVTQAPPLSEALLDQMAVETDPLVLRPYIHSHYIIGLAKVDIGLITQHLQQRVIVPSHVDKLEGLYGDLGPNLDDMENWGYAVAGNRRWLGLSHNTKTPITVSLESGLDVQCVVGGHRVHALDQWSVKHDQPLKRSWTMWILHPGEFILFRTFGGVVYHLL